MDLTPPQVLSRLRAGTLPKELKRSLAMGIFPLPPAALVEALITLARDSDKAVRDEAVRSLKKLPKAMILGVCSGAETPTALLDSLARLFGRNAEALEKILLNPAVEDRTVAHIATLPFPVLLEIVGRSHVRLERSPAILESLRANPATPAHIVGLVEEAEARRRSKAPPPEGKEPAARPQPAKAVEEEQPEGGLPPALLEEEEEEHQPAREEQKLTVLQLLKEMSAGQKVALAMKGNAEVRKALIRDKNRLICEKVLENPRITDTEIESYAKSTNVSVDVLRYIGGKREWASQPAVMRSLVSNPRTPIGLSLGFLRRLSLKELEGLSKNRNVPEAVRNTARKMAKQKAQSQR